jgi:hypothetical protein
MAASPFLLFSCSICEHGFVYRTSHYSLYAESSQGGRVYRADKGELAGNGDEMKVFGN